MYPDYQDGDHVVVLSQSTMDRSGQVGVVRYNDETATLKRIEYVMGEDWMTLRPINPQFPPVTIRDAELEECTVFGVAKYVIRELNQ
jgi:SOS-response transcriptional repressor LexA